jgi:hypothetical protein
MAPINFLKNLSPFAFKPLRTTKPFPFMAMETTHADWLYVEDHA